MMAVFLSNYVFPTRYSLGTTQIQGAQTRLPTLILPFITPCLDTDLFGVFQWLYTVTAATWFSSSFSENILSNEKIIKTIFTCITCQFFD